MQEDVLDRTAVSMFHTALFHRYRNSGIPLLTVPGAMHWYRSLYAGTGVYKWGPPYPAPSHRCPPRQWGRRQWDRCPSVQCSLVHCSSVQCRRIHSSVYAHWPVCTVYTLYSVYVQCTVYTLISVTIVYTDQCIARVYTDQCVQCTVCTVVQWQWIPTVSVCTVSMVYSLYSVTGNGRKKGKITLAY